MGRWALIIFFAQSLPFAWCLPSPTKVTLSFDAFDADPEPRPKKHFVANTITRQTIVFYTYFDFSSTHVLSSLIENKVKRLPSFDWGCGKIDKYAVEQNDTYKHIIVHARRQNCRAARQKITEQEALDAKENKSKLLESPSLPKENEMSKLLRYFVVPFLLTVVVVGYSLLRVLNYPKKAVSSPGLPRQGGIQAKDTFTQNEIRKSQKKKKLKLKRKDRKKRTSKMKGASAAFPQSVSFLSTALSASDAKSMENAVDMLNVYLPELGKWKFRKKAKPGTKSNGNHAGNIELNGNILTEDASRKFAFLVQEIIENDEDK